LQGVYLNGAKVVSTDFPALNGYVYVIDKVFLLRVLYCSVLFFANYYHPIYYRPMFGFELFCELYWNETKFN